MKKTLLIIITAFALMVACKPKEVVGPAGASGTNGTNGTNGTDGTDGTNGKDGKDGTNGKDGQNGNDGNANVITYLRTTDQFEWRSTSNYYLTSYDFDDIPKSTIDSGYVAVTMLDNTTWRNLPYTSDAGVLYTFKYNNFVSINRVEINVFDAGNIWTKTKTTFKITFISSK